MAIPFQCQGCGGQFAAPDQLAGKKARCQRCGAVVQVPLAQGPGPRDAGRGDSFGVQGSQGALAAQAFGMAMGAQPAGSYGAQPATSYPAQHGGSYGAQPAGGYGAQPAAGFGAQQATLPPPSYPQHNPYLHPAVSPQGGGMPW